MENKQTRITFEDVTSGKMVVINISEHEEEADSFNINIDFGNEGLESHGDGGLYAGLCNDFCEQVLGIMDNAEEVEINIVEK